MKTKKYKALLLDLDDTLIKSNTLYDKALLHVTKHLTKRFSLDEKTFFNTVMDKEMIIQRSFPSVHTRHSRILVFRMALDEVVKVYDLSILPDVEDMYWQYFLEHIVVYDNVKSTLKTLREHGVKISVISDGALGLRIKKVKAAGLIPYLDQIFASEEVIFEKPFGALFTLAISKLEVEAKETIMLGNNYKNDIRGAQLVGIRAGMFDPPEDGNPMGQDMQIRVVPDFVINDFSEIIQEMGY
ncbi:HAD-IA family hydrolase [Candidatus Dojkabacteria bacterium]|nr:HAD-IA family hydrolase [Candidatus Dojkabacteria bacterium]